MLQLKTFSLNIAYQAQPHNSYIHFTLLPFFSQSLQFSLYLTVFNTMTLLDDQAQL